jgi:hypothetical protein
VLVSPGISPGVRKVDKDYAFLPKAKEMKFHKDGSFTDPDLP